MSSLILSEKYKQKKIKMSSDPFVITLRVKNETKGHNSVDHNIFDQRPVAPDGAECTHTDILEENLGMKFWYPSTNRS